MNLTLEDVNIIEGKKVMLLTINGQGISVPVVVSGSNADNLSSEFSIGFSTAENAFFQNFENPDLKISDTAPVGGWKKGLYFLTDVGLYTNLTPNITTEVNKLNIGIFDGSTWKKKAIDLPNGGESTVEIPFSAVVKFNNKKTVSKKTLSSNITYTYDNTNALSNSQRCDEIIPNGYSITFSSSFTTKIQSDIDYSKPISVLFIQPLTSGLKPLAIVVNISEVDTSVTLPRYKVNTIGGSTINTWFEWFEFEGHIVDSDDCAYNIGFFNYQGANYILGNFTNVGQGASGRWANFSIAESDWEANKIYSPDGVSISGVKFKTGSVKPTSLIQANTSDYTLVQI